MAVRIGLVQFSLVFGSVRLGWVGLGLVWVRFGLVWFGWVQFGSVRIGSVWLEHPVDHEQSKRNEKRKLRNDNFLLLRRHLLQPPLVGIALIGCPLCHRRRRRQLVHIFHEVGAPFAEALDVEPTFLKHGIAVSNAALLARAVAPLLGG